MVLTFDYSADHSRSVWIYFYLSCWVLSSFLDLKIAVFHQLWKILSHYHYLSEHYLLPFLFCPSGVCVRRMWDLLISLNFAFIVSFVILCNLDNTSNQLTYCFFKFVWSLSIPLSFYLNDSILFIFGKYFVVLVKNLSIFLKFFLILVSHFMSLVNLKVFILWSVSLIILLFLDLLTLALNCFFVNSISFLILNCELIFSVIFCGKFLQHWKRLQISFCHNTAESF